MIESITVTNLRGIRQGKLEGLSPLTVIVGPNSAGKSTLIEALLIGAGLDPVVCVAVTVEARSDLRHGARWLFWRGAEERTAKIEVSWQSGEKRILLLSWKPEYEIETDKRKALSEPRSRGPYSAIEVRTSSGEHYSERHATFAADNTFSIDEWEGPKLPAYSSAWILDTRSNRYAHSLHDLYSKITERGHRRQLKELFKPIIPGMEGFEILTENNDPVLHILFPDRSVPAALVGEGIQGLLRIAFGLTNMRGGTTLIEEPEVYQHPAAIALSARVLVEAARRGAQIIMTTHSMELLDGLLAELKDEELALLSLQRVRLENGDLRTSRVAGPEVAMMRVDIGEDLR